MTKFGNKERNNGMIELIKDLIMGVRLSTKSDHPSPSHHSFSPDITLAFYRPFILSFQDYPILVENDLDS